MKEETQISFDWQIDFMALWLWTGLWPKGRGRETHHSRRGSYLSCHHLAAMISFINWFSAGEICNTIAWSSLIRTINGSHVLIQFWCYFKTTKAHSYIAFKHLYKWPWCILNTVIQWVLQWIYAQPLDHGLCKSVETLLGISWTVPAIKM